MTTLKNTREKKEKKVQPHKLWVILQGAEEICLLASLGL